jgi:hypothetical protein
MQKIIWRLLLLTGIAAGGGGYYAWQQVTTLPTIDNTQAGVVDFQPAQPQKIAKVKQQIENTDRQIRAKIDRTPVGKPVEVKLDDRELAHLIAARIATTDRTSKTQISQAISQIDTKISAGKIHAGAVVNLGQLSQGNADSDIVKAVNKLTAHMPMLKEQDVYVSIVGTPTIQNNRVKLDPDTKIKVGNVGFSIAEIATNLGISEEKIYKLIDLKLQQSNLSLDRLSIADGRAILQGLKKN